MHGKTRTLIGPRRKAFSAAIATVALLGALNARGGTFEVTIQSGGGASGLEHHDDPPLLTIRPGDTVRWTWNDTANHSVVSGQGNGLKRDGLFDSGVQRAPFTFSVTFPNVGKFPYYCGVHAPNNQGGTFPEITVKTPAPGTSQPLNISTRMRVQTGDKVMIGGFIITGNVAKKVIIRALGPALAQFGIADVLADPVLELRAADGSVIKTNDNWKETQQAEIQNAGFAPQNDVESALIATLNPGSYTAIVSGKNQGTGVGLVELYDMDEAADAQLANISTRGFVLTGTNVMIGGFILGKGTGAAYVAIRGIGPSLTQFGVADALSDPTLELRDSNGALIRNNDNWQATQENEVQTAGMKPRDPNESVILATLPPGAYTAILMGKGSATGVGLVELYTLP